MARPKSVDRLAALEQRRGALEQQIKAAKEAAARRKREAAARRKYLLGSAVLAHFNADDVAAIIRLVIPSQVKAKDDLALFDAWLAPAETPGQSAPEPTPSPPPA